MTDPHEAVWKAIEAFTNPIRQNDGTIVPSLWDQLRESVDTSAGHGGRGVSGQPPLNTAVVSLLDEVQRDLAQDLRNVGLDPINRYTRTIRTAGLDGCWCKPYQACKGYRIYGFRWRDIPAELRLLNNKLAAAAPDARIILAKRINTWCSQAAAILTPPGHITLLRGHHCIDCGARTVTVWNNGEYVNQPALRLIWADNEDPMLSRIDYVHCQNCGRSRWTADLHLIAEHTVNLNLTAETVADRVLSTSVDETRPSKVRRAPR